MAAPFNKAVEIIDAMRDAPSFATMISTIQRATVASSGQGKFSARTVEKLIPLLRAASRHSQCPQQDKIKFAEMVRMVQSGAAPKAVLDIFDTEGTRVEAAKKLTQVELVNTEKRDQSQDNVPVEASQSGLYEEALAFTRSRGADAVFSVEDVLHAMDQRFPYAKPSGIFRPLSEVREELAVYMELDEILAKTTELDPYGIAARHRIKMTEEQVLAGPEPLFFRQIRWRCQTDLFFLARAICGKRFTNYTHRRMVEHLVLKNPLLPIQEQDETKDRLTMSPRGSFKSTISVLDILQWIIGFPNDIRIMVVTSVTKLAKRFVGELKQYLIKAKDSEPTLFQMLFPEFVVPPSEDGRGSEYTVKNRKSGLKDPTLWAASVTSDEVGGHVDVLVFDDAQSVENCGTPETMENLLYKVSMLKALVDPGGYRQYIGTPLAPGDLYFSMKNNLDGLKVLYEPAMIRKPDSLSKNEEDCEEEDFTLLFPERLTWSFLQAAKKENLGVYRSQYLLDPRGVTEVTFPIELLVNQTIDQGQIPDHVTHAIAFDLAYSQGPQADETVGAVAAIDIQGRTFIKKIIHGKFTPTEIADEIVSAFIEFHPLQIVIEASNGAMILESIIRQMAERRNVTEHIPLNFLKVNNKRGAKVSRISVLETLLKRSLLFFANDIDCLDELYKQFTEFGVTRHDDLPDAISLLFASGAAKLVAAPPDPAVQQQILADQSYRAFHDMIFPETPIAQEVKLEEQFYEPVLEDPYAVPGMPSRPVPAGR